MPLNELLVTELDIDSARTRRVLERLPPGQADWRPHAKSTPLGRLAGHVAEIPFLGTTILGSADAMDVSTLRNRERTPVATSADALAILDRELVPFRAALAQASDEQLMRPWAFRHGDHVIASGPRILQLRNFVFSHIVHHRAQLVVYLRLLDVPVPGTFGPSADEPM